MKHKWTQPYSFGDKYHQMWLARQLIESAHLAVLLDTQEPITNLTQAQTYLKRFSLKDSRGY